MEFSENAFYYFLHKNVIKCQAIINPLEYNKKVLIFIKPVLKHFKYCFGTVISYRSPVTTPLENRHCYYNVGKLQQNFIP